MPRSGGVAERKLEAELSGGRGGGGGGGGSGSGGQDMKT